MKTKLPRGEDVVSAKMTKDRVKSLRQDYSSGQFTQKDLSRKYGISQSMVSYIILNRYWKD